MTKIIYVNEQHGRVTMDIVHGSAGDGHPVLDVNGLLLGVSASAAMAGFFENLKDEDNPWM